MLYLKIFLNISFHMKVFFLQEIGMKVVVRIYYYFRMYNNRKATTFFILWPSHTSYFVSEYTLRGFLDCRIRIEKSTTNRVESAHSWLKKYLTSSMSDLSTNWKSVHDMLELQHTHIHAFFQTSIIMPEHRSKGKVLWSRLIWNISRNTSHYLTNEFDVVLKY